ncbi:MAG: FAD-dependent oxidoreductase, partial [Acidimicrobiia bacterium]|nr:FAD-dependent oxidoreductase [Acidimicrobiia bacterium]
MAQQTTGQSIGIVGGGIVGLAIGRELTRRLAGVEIQIFEKEPDLAVHQTGHNSGVVHAGIYYKPGSLKAELCTRGRHLLQEFCQDRRLPYEECGKLVVAIDPSELGRLDNLDKTATENAVPGLRRVDAAEITEIEPHGTGLAALHSPHTAITDFVAVARAYAEDIDAADGKIRLSSPVTGIRRHHGRVEITTPSGGDTVDRLVICAGLQSDRVAESVDGERGPR